MSWDVGGVRITRVVEQVMAFPVDFFAEATPADVAAEAWLTPDFVNADGRCRATGRFTVGAAAIVAGWARAGADVTTTWPQNSLVALNCEARIVRGRSGFQRIRIAVRPTPATHCHALPVGGR